MPDYESVRVSDPWGDDVSSPSEFGGRGGGVVGKRVVSRLLELPDRDSYEDAAFAALNGESPIEVIPNEEVVRAANPPLDAKYYRGRRGPFTVVVWLAVGFSLALFFFKGGM